MSAPTPLTRTSIVLLSESSVKPIGTLRSPPKSIHGISAALISGLAKTTQLQMKLIDTATTEINALTLGARRVTRAINTALAKGASKTSQGIILKRNLFSGERMRPRVLSLAPRQRLSLVEQEAFRRGAEMCRRGRVRSPDLNRNIHDQLVDSRSKSA